VQKAGWAANQNVNSVGPCTTGTTPAAVTGAPTVTCTGTPSNATVYGGVAAGVASGLPAFELRGTVIAGPWSAWISGHWQNNDFNGPGAIANEVLWTNRQTVLGTFGFKGALGPVALSGSAWYGKNAGPLLGSIVQFTPANYAGDIFGWGGWAQGGFNFTKQMSLWYTFGIDIPQFQDIMNASSYNTPGSTVALFKNMNQVAMIRYSEGGFMMGLEYMYSRTYSVKNSDAPAIGQQISLSANYFF
jgi:hypothetical protein